MHPRLILAEQADETPSGRKMTIEGEAVIDIQAAASEGDGKPCMSTFTMTANTGAPMRLAGWKYPVVLDMEGIQIPRQKAPIRLQHDASKGVGHSESIGVVGGKLMATGVISRSTESARDVRESAKNGFPWQVSVGATADDVEFVKEGMKAAVNGQEIDGPVNIARKSTLGEISFVDLGADPHTDAMIAHTDANNAHALRIAAAKDGGDGDDGEPVDGAAATQQIIVRAKVERKRQEGIRALTEEYSGYRGADIDEIEKITAQALDEHWTLEQTELGLLRASRAKPVQTASGAPVTRKVIEAALCLYAGVSDKTLVDDREYGAEVVEAAWPLRNGGLRGAICAALEGSGVRVPHGSRELYDTVIENQRGGGRIQAAGFSTVNLPGVLGNVANKILIEAFTKVDATYDRLADQADFSNFHIHSIYRLEATGDFRLVPPDGELHHGTLEQDNFTNKIDTYGRMLTITRQDIINDDMNAFRSLTAQLARRARLAVEKALYSLVAESSDVFYTSARNNRLTTTPLDITGLASAESSLVSQTDVNQDPIYAVPRFLVVPPALRYYADQLFSSDRVMPFITGKSAPTDNPFKGRFEVITSPYLSNVNVSGYSTTTWYLVADPLMLPAWQVAYLEGRRAPTVETAEALFNVLGLQMRAYWDFGVSQIDYRGAVKATA